MKTSMKRFFTSLSIVTLLAPIFLASVEVFAEDLSTNKSSEVITETMPEIVPPVNEPILENEIPDEPMASTNEGTPETSVTESSTDSWTPENTTDGFPQGSTAPSSTDEGIPENSNTEPSTTDQTDDGTTDSSNNPEDTSPTDVPPVTESTEETSTPEDSSDNEWTGGIGLDDLEINQTIEETFTVNAADIVKNNQNENYVLKTKDGKISIKLDLNYYTNSWSGFDKKENFLSGYAHGAVSLTDDSYGKLYSFSDYSPGFIEVYDFNSSSDQAFYLKDKKGRVTEYLISLELENHEPTLEDTFEMSETNSGKPFSTKDGLVTITPDYEQFNWKLQTNNDNWEILNYEPYSISKAYEKRTYHISIYSEKLQQVKSYAIPVERVISEGTIIEHEVDIKLSQNNQFRFENEFYQEYPDIFSGLSITAYFNGWDYIIELNQKNEYYLESLYYDNIETDAQYTSYFEQSTWTDGFYDDESNWVEPVETKTKLKLNISIDNTTEIDESKEKIFTFNLDHNQLIMNSKEDKPYEVSLNYGGPSNHSETFRIAYLNTTDFNDNNDYNYKGEYVEVSEDKSYVNLLREEILGTVESSTNYGNKIIFNINNAPTLEESTLNIDVSRKNDSDNPIEISPESDDNLIFSAYHDGYDSYYLNYEYDYDGIHYYELLDDWEYSVHEDTGTLTKTLYKRKDYGGKIVAIYHVQFNLEKIEYQLQEPIELFIPKKLGFNRVYAETPDGQAVLAGEYFLGESYDGSAYSSFTVEALLTKKGLENNTNINFDYYHFTPGEEPLPTEEKFLYTVTSDGEYKKYPVIITPDVNAPEPTIHEYHTFDIQVTAQELSHVSEDGIPGKVLELKYSEYESIWAKVHLDKETGEPVLFASGFLPPLEKISEYQYTTKDYLYIFNLTITDWKVEEVLPKKITLSDKKVTISAGETATIKATITPENATNKSITWTSKDEKIATVTNGVITGLKAGKTTITAETVNGLKKSVEVTVEKAPEKPVDREELPDSSGTGVSVSAPKGVLPKGAELKVEPIKENNNVHEKLDELTDGKFMLFDIKLHNTEAGQNVQPNGTVQVKVPIPTGFDPSKIRMYRFDSLTGKRTALNGWVDGAYYVFETDQFSYYALVEEEPTVSKEALNELITKAKDLQGENYTVESWKTLTEKLRVANAIAGNELASDSDVKQAIAELNTAIDALVQKPVINPDDENHNEKEPEEDKESNNNSNNSNTSKPNKPSDPEAKPSEKTDTTPETKKDNALPQLGSSASVLLPALGLLLMGLSSLIYFGRNRLN